MDSTPAQRKPLAATPIRRFMVVFASLAVPLLGVFWAQDLGSWWFDLGLRPTVWTRWWTMFTSVWLHASINHVASNLFALILLVWLGTYTYPRTMTMVIPGSIVGSGLAILCLGSPLGGGHIGASGVSYGLMAMFVTMTALRRTRMSIGVFMVVAFLFGAAWWGLLPIIPYVSWEGHLGGALGGAISTIVFWRRDPVKPEERGFVLEDTEDDAPPPLPGSPPMAVHSKSRVV